MSLHIVSKASGPYRPGTWFECFEDGCQQVEIETVDNRVKVTKEVGLIVPQDMVMPYVTSIGKWGLRRHG